MFVYTEEENSNQDNNHNSVTHSEVQDYLKSSKESGSELLSLQKPGKTHKTFSVCGTPQYMSPELIAEQGHDM